MRIAKYISSCNYCSRREAEKLILNNQVMVDNNTVSDCSFKVSSTNKVYVKNILLSIPETSIWLYNKPIQTIVSRIDDRGRKVIFDHLPKKLRNLITIGRLDYNSEGLLLLTNNGELARYLELPINQINRKYLVKTFGSIDKNQLIKKLSLTTKINDTYYKPIQCSIIRNHNQNSWLSMTLTEGKNREIRKILESFGLLVSRLIRTEYGKLKLNNLKLGSIVEAPKNIIEHYKEKLLEYQKNL